MDNALNRACDWLECHRRVTAAILALLIVTSLHLDKCMP